MQGRYEETTPTVANGESHPLQINHAGDLKIANSVESINISEDRLIKTGTGEFYGFIVNSHTNGTIKIIDGTEGGAAASAVLTSSGAMVPASHATSELTSDTTNVSDGDTVTINTTVYRFKDTPAQAYDVQIGASAAVSLDNLKAAINQTGTPGTEYYPGTLAHPTVIATTNTDTVQTVVARTPGVTANTYPTTETSSHLSWADTTLGGGTGNSDAGATTAAATFTIGTRTYMFVVELSETSGADPIADQILYGGSVAAALDNMKLAINATGLAGTNYSTGTTVNTQVIATTNTNTAQTIVSKEIGTGSNSIATTETLANTAWGAATMAGGTGANGKILLNTITLAAGPQTWISPVGIKAEYGIYADIGGTIDATILYK